MDHLGYKSCVADPDLWYKSDVREEDKYKYHSYVILYVDYCLCLNHSAEEELNKIDKFFKMKAGSLGDPDTAIPPPSLIMMVDTSTGNSSWAQLLLLLLLVILFTLSPLSSPIMDDNDNASFQHLDNIGSSQDIK